MQPDWKIYRAMLHCPNKAWQLLKEEGNHAECVMPVNKLTPHDKIAIAASYYHEVKPVRYLSQVQKLVVNVKQMTDKGEPPVFYKNAHCPQCPFWKSCHQKLKDRDCISLLAGMSPKVLSKYHSKGIFTVLQLSHIFRLRRKRNRPQASGSYLWELKALAIREKKTYVLQLPEIKEHTVSIYIDFEGLPEQDFIYLIGAVIRQEGKSDEQFYYWANNKDNEETIFQQLFDLLQQYPEATIFHYGSYETKAFKKWKKIYKEQIFGIEERMINLLSFFRTHVYPPTYTNGLKEIAGFLGFQWQDIEADGLASMKWRKNWEATAGEKWKTQLIRYNLDDCLALARVREWLKLLTSDGEKDNVQQVSKMKKHTPYRLQNNSEYGEDFQCISRAAYFDYQHSKIYWRHEKKPSTASAYRKKSQPKHSGRGHPVWQPKKVNEVIQIPPLKKCPHCGHGKLYHSSKQRSFRKTDLKFTPTGIKQWVIEYLSGKGKCARCAMKYNDSVLRQLHLGDNLLAWAVNLYVNYHVSFAMISRLLEEQFGIWTNPTYFNDRNYQWWQKFKPEVEYCWQIIRHSPVIHIDETTVRLGKGKERGYVWVFATPHTIFYHLTLTREAGFLQEWIKDYKGVIVTDFFPGYESIPVKRQKCLIHLIRDLNDDLFKTPFDEGYKLLVNSFSQLLKKIITTIDRYGLRKVHLRKHIKDTNHFYKHFVETEQESELSMKYAKRFKKHWDELWTFLQHDGLPWNNNNAEAAIKAFAQHRRGVNGQVSEDGLKEYLSMLTVAQTCRYRDISFIDFLRSKAGIWQNIHPDLLRGFLPYNQARLFVQKHKLKNRKEWELWKGSSKRPAYITVDPDITYESKGWKNWEDWLRL